MHAIGKKALAILMSVVLVVGLCPGLAFAAGGGAQGDALTAGSIADLQAQEDDVAPWPDYAILYKNGDFVIQATAEADGKAGHTASDVAATFTPVDNTEPREVVDEWGNSYTEYVYKWYDYRADI